MAVQSRLVQLAYDQWNGHPTRFLAIFVLVVVFLSRLLLTVKQYRRLQDFKGPPFAAVSNLWMFSAVAGKNGHLEFYKVTKKYGSLSRIGPNDLLNDDPRLMRRMNGVRSDYRRPDWYDGMRLNPTKNNVLSWRDEDEHTKLRSKMAAGYSGREVADLEQKIDENLLRLIALIDGYIDAGKPFDFGRKAQYLTLDVISDLAFGEPFGFIETDSDVHEYIQTTEKSAPFFMMSTVFPWVMKIFATPLLKPLLPSETDSLGFGKVMGVAKEVAAERYGPNKKVQKDMLGSFVAHGLTQDEAEAEILVQIMAGSDTTATGIRATILHVITNPRVYNRLMAEIAAATATRPVITDAEARNLPYFQAVIKEGLRIFPPVGGLMPKETPAAGDTWEGKFIPGGTRIGWSVWAMFRRQDIWGADAGEFRPERWLVADAGGETAEGKLREMEATIDMMFAYGRFQCLGRPLALIELNKVLFELLRRFELTVCDPANPWKTFNAGIHVQSEYWIRAHRRE
ncbi:Pisatin demethylase 19 [Colletotrichum chlorophyti]|uniref:Pisatin demethylase 19 n=1 Tax=Colletotrichum chlorophyti TaxID=708187 RepID=A0A1Q8RNI1_9PEZI|nr:Pisatin demethylase 19 [Colletotrichum chlorophyti]